MKIKYILQNFNSRRNFYGNCYWAARITRVSDGKRITFKSDHESNVEAGLKELLGGWDGIGRTTGVEMPIREFDRFSKNLSYCGCQAKDIAKFIEEEFKNAA